MTTPLHPDLNRWLDTVTQNLPADAAAYTRNEIIAHYEDAVADYTTAGSTPEEAHAQAMADLGQDADTARGLKDAHLGYRRYQWAMLASLAMLVSMLGLPIVYLALGLKHNSIGATTLYITSDVLLFGLTTFVLFTLKELLTWRFNLPGASRFIRLSIGGLALQILADISSLMLYGYSHNISSKQVTIFQVDSGWEAGLHVASLVGFLFLGIGLLGLARQLSKAQTTLYGLGKPLVILLTILGGLFTTGWFWLNVNSFVIAELGGALAQFSHFLLWPLLTLLFFRVIYRPTDPPTRLA